VPTRRARQRTAATHPPRAVIIGGGLAGMTAAKVLAEHGMPVTILEAGDHLGGKAASTRVHGRWEDHGFHCFPAWYVNTRALLADIGCEPNLIDIHRFHFLKKGAYPQLVTTYEFTSPQNVLHNLFNGVLPWHENLLSYYCLLELACEPLASWKYLDQISGTGFLRSRFYATEAIANLQQQTILQAAAIPGYECSALTLQRLFRAWLKWSSPLYSILNGSLQEKFIGPFEQRLRRLGVEVRYKSRVKAFIGSGNRARGVMLARREAPLMFGSDDFFIMATPREVQLEFESSDAEYRKEVSAPVVFWPASLGLQSAPMAALHLYLKRRIPDLPQEHINLVGSRYGTTLIDISQHWEGLEGTTLSAVLARPWVLFGRPDEAIAEMVVDEIREYLPIFTQRDVAGEPHLQTHVAQPLFINTVGSWLFRPTARFALHPNIFRAGDFCQTEADLATMESAVMSGINAAAEILQQAGKRVHMTPLSIGEPPQAALTLLKYMGLPLVAPIGLWKRMQGRLTQWTRPPTGG
jgi:uncharacterized protein with NAD-binding domain and iron-sulfur cluster